MNGNLGLLLIVVAGYTVLIRRDQETSSGGDSHVLHW